MRTWGASGAGAALRRAQVSSAYARRRGCGVDEADELVHRQLSRRQFLVGAGAAAVGTTALWATPAGADPRRSTGRSGRGRRAPSGRVVIVGSGIAGLGCAYRLWLRHGIAASVYEYNTLAGGRIRTLRGYFDDDQLVEEHAEFVNPEHTATLALARNFGLSLDNTDKYPSGTHPQDETLRFHGKPWSQTQVNDDWHTWGWKLFHDAAFNTAPWPQLYNHNNPGGRLFDHMSATEWIDRYIPGGMASDFGALCVSAILDEFGGPPDEQSALNLVYLLGEDDSVSNGFQPRRTPALGGANEKWHIHGGTDLLISGLIDRLPPGTVNLDQELVAVRPSGNGYACTFQTGATTYDVAADHVVLALPFTRLRSVDLSSCDIAPLHQQAIEEEPLGSNAKFFVQCTNRVWNKPDRADGNAYCLGLVQGAWDPTIYQSGAAGILAALPGGTVGQDWGGRYGLTTYRGTPPGPMTNDYLAAFNTLFAGLSQAYNGRSFFVWSSGDPHILGAYSYLKVGQYTAFNGIQGQQEGNLHFAGEQTSINFQGYIEGGLRSGYRCADQIVGRPGPVDNLPADGR
jgi:monoamine oxidase